MERDTGSMPTRSSLSISIHALRMERDPPNIGAIKEAINFNPRAPHGARPGESTAYLPWCKNFNPRAPHGARPNVPVFTADRVTISIHALRMERDGSRMMMWRPEITFQSTRSAWSATGCACHAGFSSKYFNPRAPHGARRTQRSAYCGAR